METLLRLLCLQALFMFVTKDPLSPPSPLLAGKASSRVERFILTHHMLIRKLILTGVLCSLDYADHPDSPCVAEQFFVVTKALSYTDSKYLSRAGCLLRFCWRRLANAMISLWKLITCTHWPFQKRRREDALARAAETCSKIFTFTGVCLGARSLARARVQVASPSPMEPISAGNSFDPHLTHLKRARSDSVDQAPISPFSEPDFPLPDPLLVPSSSILPVGVESDSDYGRVLLYFLGDNYKNDDFFTEFARSPGQVFEMMQRIGREAGIPDDDFFVDPVVSRVGPDAIITTVVPSPAHLNKIVEAKSSIFSAASGRIGRFWLNGLDYRATAEDVYVLFHSAGFTFHGAVESVREGCATVSYDPQRNILPDEINDPKFKGIVYRLITVADLKCSCVGFNISKTVNADFLIRFSITSWGSQSRRLSLL